VTGIRPKGNGRYQVTTERAGAWLRKHRKTFVASDVVLAAGRWAPETAARHARRRQPRQPFAQAWRADSFELGGDNRRAHIQRNVDFSRGVAITSSFYPDEQTTSSPCATAGQQRHGLLTTALADGDGRSRLLTWAREVLRHPVMLARNLSMHGGQSRPSPPSSCRRARTR